MVPWRNFQTTAPTLEQVTTWWTEQPDANIALVLGRGMFAVDLDGGHKAESLLNAFGIVLPSAAPRSKTANGYHVFLSADIAVPDRVGMLSGPTGGKPQVDIRGVGIVVVPPSIHPSGAAYEWERPFDGSKPPEAPSGLLEMIRRKSNSETTAPAERVSSQSWVKDALAGVGEGQRDQACTRLAGYFLHKGLDADTVEALLVSGFAKNCTPAFDARDVRKCVLSIARKESVDGTDREIAPKQIGAVLEELQQAVKAGPPSFLATPFATLNHMLNGGFGAGELVFLGARPGVGKTALGLELARKAAQHGSAVLVVSREMTNLALARRMVAQHAKIRASALKRSQLNDTEERALVDSVRALSGLPLWMTDEAVSIAEINQMVAEMSVETSLGLVMVDYLQLIRAPRDIKERRHQVEAVSQGLKTIAMQYKLPVLCLSSLARPADKAVPRRPQLADLRESGELEHDADIILFLHRAYDQEATECIVAKNREGRLGTVNLLFRAEYVAFHEVADALGGVA